MLQYLKTTRRLPAMPTPYPASVPDGQRWYVIGDVHGRCDLFDAIVTAIDRDDAAAGPAETTVVLLGDLIDRGPESAGVVAVARAWQRRRRVRLLAGNHEDMFLASFYDSEMLRYFLRHGGRETLLSYGLEGARDDGRPAGELQADMARAVPEDDLAFLRTAEEWIEVGDYLLVHAGINPSRPLAEQRRSDLLWIRDPFLRHDKPFGRVVVHGHTICDEVEDTGYRVGIDTGAYQTGRLTALVLEGGTRRVIQAVKRDGSVGIERTTAVPPGAMAQPSIARRSTMRDVARAG